jgi:hypothetical protein
MSTPAITYTYVPQRTPHLTFTWEGGPYIDVMFTHTHETADCINVWDYEKDTPRISVAQFANECEQYVTDTIDYPGDDR